MSIIIPQMGFTFSGVRGEGSAYIPHNKKNTRRRCRAHVMSDYLKGRPCSEPVTLATALTPPRCSNDDIDDDRFRTTGTNRARGGLMSTEGVPASAAAVAAAATLLRRGGTDIGDAAMALPRATEVSALAVDLDVDDRRAKLNSCGVVTSGVQPRPSQ